MHHRRAFCYIITSLNFPKKFTGCHAVVIVHQPFRNDDAAAMTNSTALDDFSR